MDAPDGTGRGSNLDDIGRDADSAHDLPPPVAAEEEAREATGRARHLPVHEELDREDREPLALPELEARRQPHHVWVAAVAEARSREGRQERTREHGQPENDCSSRSAADAEEGLDAPEERARRGGDLVLLRRAGK